LDGNFFSVFAKVHPKYKFPHISLLAVGGVGFIFSLLFKLGDVITAILTMRILVQFVSQAIGLIAWHYKKPGEERPYKMPLFPLPAILCITIWLFIYSTIDYHYILSSLGIVGSGVFAYFIFMRKPVTQV
jgi:amino acid transporter